MTFFNVHIAQQRYPEFYRADGNCICKICNKLYIDHPMSKEYLSWVCEPYLHILCNGDLVKL